MRSPTPCLWLVLVLAARSEPLADQAITDADVAKGVRQVQDGDLDVGIFTLDAAARRLAGDPSRAKELAQACLYLGIAYLGKGQETLAKARFKDAVVHDPTLRLEAELFSLRVLELFERAREEAGQSPSRQTSTPLPTVKKGGSKKALVLIGVGGAVAAGVAVAAGGGGGTGTGTPAASVSAPDTRITTSITGRLTLANVAGQFNNDWRIDVAGTGQLEATLTWSESNALVSMHLYDERGAGNPIVRGSQSATTRVQLSASVTPKTYMIGVFQCGVALSACQTGQSRDVATYTLTVLHP